MDGVASHKAELAKLRVRLDNDPMVMSVLTAVDIDGVTFEDPMMHLQLCQPLRGHHEGFAPAAMNDLIRERL